MEKYMLPCIFKKISGIDCPGCGTQRSLLLLSQGEFALAFRMFPAVYTSILLALVIGLHFVDKSRNYHLAIRGLAILNAAIIIIAYIYKMTNFN